MITFDIPLIPVLQLVLGVVLPVLVGLVTTRATSAGRKAVLLAGLAVVTSLLTELVAALQAGTVYNLGLALVLGLGTFIVAVATHYGLLKPTGVSHAAQSTLRTADTIPGEVAQEDYNGIPSARPAADTPLPTRREAREAEEAREARDSL